MHGELKMHVDCVQNLFIASTVGGEVVCVCFKVISYCFSFFFFFEECSCLRVQAPLFFFFFS